MIVKLVLAEGTSGCSEWEAINWQNLIGLTSRSFFRWWSAHCALAGRGGRDAEAVGPRPRPRRQSGAVGGVAARLRCRRRQRRPALRQTGRHGWIVGPRAALRPAPPAAPPVALPADTGARHQTVRTGEKPTKILSTRVREQMCKITSNVYRFRSCLSWKHGHSKKDQRLLKQVTLYLPHLPYKGLRYSFTLEPKTLFKEPAKTEMLQRTY